MSLTIEELDVNEIRAEIGKSVNGLKFANFCYGDDHRKVPNILVYGGMEVRKGKYGKFFELDIKDDETEEFFKSLEETLLRVGGACLDEKPWKLKSPVIEYGSCHSVRCKIYPSSNIDLKKYHLGYREIRPYHAFSGKTRGITLAVNKIIP